jgi:dephospho-CoA kinase
MNDFKIAITGRMGSGKSSLSKIIQEQEQAYVTSFSSKIRDIVVELNLTPNRTILQETGDFFRKFDEHVWTNALLKEIDKIEKSIVIDGIRYEFERNKLVSSGFKIIKIITSSDTIRRSRISKRDNVSISNDIWEKWQNHPTELYVDKIIADYSITNNDSLEKLKISISEILDDLKTK